MGFAIARELVHKLVGYLDCGHVFSLPWEMAPGCFWETRFLGGRLLGYMVDRSDPLGVRQAGKIYLLKGEPGETVERARELDESYVQRILNFGRFMPAYSHGFPFSNLPRLFLCSIHHC